jgi:hypothetical protein
LDEFYKSDLVQCWRGYRVIGIDGSTVELPNLDEPEPKRKKPNFMTKSWNCLPNATKIKFPVC